MLLESSNIISLYWRNWSISFCGKGQLNSDTLEVCCRLIYFWRADGSIRIILRLHIIKNVCWFRCFFSLVIWTHEHRENNVMVRNWLIISFVYMRIRISSVFFVHWLLSFLLLYVVSRREYVLFTTRNVFGMWQLRWRWIVTFSDFSRRQVVAGEILNIVWLF